MKVDLRSKSLNDKLQIMKHNQQLGNFKLPEAELDEHFHYKISRGRKIDDFCRIRLYALKSDRPVCVLTELKNSGMSVTNAIELIVLQACDAYNLGFNTLFIEHYDQTLNIEH